MWEHIAGVMQPVSEHDMSCRGTEQYDFGGAAPLSPSVHWVAQQMVTQPPGMHANIHTCCQKQSRMLGKDSAGRHVPQEPQGERQRKSNHATT